MKNGLFFAVERILSLQCQKGEKLKKQLSEKKLERRREKEQRELKKLRAELDRPIMGAYFPFLIVVLTIVYIVDEITSSMPSSMQSEVVEEFFVRGMGMDLTTGVAAMTAMSAPFYIVMVIAPFYKALADRFGRRIFLVINTIGMGVGLFLCFISSNIYVYLIGLLVIRFVIPNDMQVMYIIECAPEKHRAKLCSLTKAIALLGVTLIPVLRTVFMGNDGTKWREVHLLPAVIAVVVGLAALFLLRETPVYLQKRVAYLEKSDEERTAERESAKSGSEAENGGVINAIKFIFKHRQTRSLAICSLVFAAATAVTSYYEPIMKSGGMTTEQITTAMYFFPFFNALLTAIGGFITDSVGRKASAVIQSVIASIALAAFIITANMGVSPVIVGVCYGLFLGTLWSVSDLLFLIMPGESTPTNLRASVIGTMSLMLGIGSVITIALVSVISVFLSDIPLGWLWFCACIPFMIVAVIILIARVHETKDNDLSSITGAEWD